MDCIKVGKLILSLRKEKDMTQKQVAELMNISDKTVSKWERGLGCPDVSLLSELSEILGVNIQDLLSGTLSLNDTDIGNMKKMKFFVCPACGNILTETGNGEVSCCGKKLIALDVQILDETHKPLIEDVENDFFITFNHGMTKEHHINFVAYVTYDRILLVKLYPEQNAEVRFPKMFGGKLYFYCNKHGLFETEIH